MPITQYIELTGLFWGVWIAPDLGVIPSDTLAASACRAAAHAARLRGCIEAPTATSMAANGHKSLFLQNTGAGKRTTAKAIMIEQVQMKTLPPVTPSDTCSQATSDEHQCGPTDLPNYRQSRSRTNRASVAALQLAKLSALVILSQSREFSMTITSVKLAALATSLLCFGIAAYAASPADTIAARQANFKQMGKGMKAISDQIKTPMPSFEAIKAGAAAIDRSAGKVAGHFPPGSGPQPGVKTGALPAIWEKNDEFKTDAAKLVRAAGAMRMAADTSNIDQVKAQFMALGATCKECHQNFRAREN